MATGDTELVLVESGDTIDTIRLNRPDKLNAVTDELLEELVDALSALHDDPNEGLVIAGAGRATCAGRDVEEVSRPDFEPTNLDNEMSELLQTFPRPTAFAGKGAVIGQGFGMALRCDFTILGEETHYSYPEINYDIDTTQSIGRIAEYTGIGAAKEIVMSGEPIDPQRAHTLGLVNDVVPEDEVEDRTYEFLEQIVDHDPEILQNMIRASRIDT